MHNLQHEFCVHPVKRKTSMKLIKTKYSDKIYTETRNEKTKEYEHVQDTAPENMAKDFQIWPKR